MPYVYIIGCEILLGFPITPIYFIWGIGSGSLLSKMLLWFDQITCTLCDNTNWLLFYPALPPCITSSSLHTKHTTHLHSSPHSKFQLVACYCLLSCHQLIQCSILLLVVHPLMFKLNMCSMDKIIV